MKECITHHRCDCTQELLDSQASEIGRLKAALELLVLDVSEYEAFERPCYALDKAREALASLKESK